MTCRSLIIFCMLWCYIGLLNANENDKTITFAVGHDHEKMLLDNYPIYRASWQFLNQSLAKLGYEVDAIILPWARANYYTQSGKADGLFLAANLPGREQWAVLSNPIGMGAFGAFYHKERKDEDKVIASVRLGVHNKILSGYHTYELLEVATAQQGFKLLYNQKVDRLIMSESYGKYLLNTELIGFKNEILFDSELIEKRSIHVAFAKNIAKSLKAMAVVNSAIDLGINDGIYHEVMTKNKVPESMFLTSLNKK